MAALRTLLMIGGLCAGLAVQAAELAVAVGVLDPAQVAGQDKAFPRGAPGAELVAVNDDLAREICRRINARCALNYIAFAEILPGVEARRFDLGFGNFLRSPERERRVAFSDTIWRSSSRLVGSPATARAFAGKLGRPVTLDSLRDARVTAIAGSQQLTFLERLPGERRLTAIGTPTPIDALQALRDDGADFALLPTLSAYSLLSHDSSGDFEFVGPAAADRGLGGTVHIILPRQHEQLRRAVNQAIAAIRSDGTYQRIVRRYFPVGLD